MASPRIYTYKVTFPNQGWWYWGAHVEKRHGELYTGSPVTHKEKWDLFEYEVQILEFFETWDEALEVEKRLISPDLNNPLCLNENEGGIGSSAACSRGGKTAASLGKTGFQTLTFEQRSVIGKKAGVSNKAKGVGYCGLSQDDRIKYGRIGGAISGKDLYKSKKGLFSESGRDKTLAAVRKATKVTNKKTHEAWIFKSQVAAAKFMGVSTSSITGYVNGRHQHKKYLVERTSL